MPVLAVTRVGWIFVMKILALDPGGRTGLAWADLRGQSEAVGAHVSPATVVRNSPHGVEEIPSHGYEEEPGDYMTIINAVLDHEPDVLVIEDFILYPDKHHSSDRVGTIPMRIIAALRHHHVNIEQLAGITFYQQPGERYIATQEMLKTNDIWITRKQGGGKDAMAAMQHLVTWIMKQ